MKTIVEKKWVELPSIWNELIDKNPIATPFQSYEYLSLTGKGKPQRSSLFRLLGVRELNLVLYEDNVPIAIAPLLYKTKKGKSTVYFRGHFTAANQLDLIYANLSYDDFKFLMDGIREILGDVSFYLDWMCCNSPTCDHLKKYLSSKNTHARESFAIPVPQKYDDWYRSLHKSRRQKLNNTKNRIAKDDVQCTTSFFIGEKIDAAIYKEMMLVYADRFLVKNNFRFGPFQGFVEKALQLFLLKDKMTRWLNNDDHSFHAIVYMNNQIAAFASGLICKNQRIILNRLAINTEFGRYNPGAILLSSTIGYLAELKEANQIDVEILDLSQGGDGGMDYKAAWGGEVYYTYSFDE